MHLCVVSSISCTMEVIRGKQENSNLYHHDGYFYYLNKTVNDTSYYRCTLWKEGCPVRANLKPDGILCTTYVHNHPSDPSRAAFMSERLALIGEARRLDVATVRDIFPTQENNPDSVLNYHSLYPAMTRARENAWPTVHNVAELSAVLNNPAYSSITALDNFADNIFGGVSEGRHGPVFLFMTSKSKEFLKIVPWVFILSCTFTVESQQYKGYTIGTEWQRNAIPLAFILLETENFDTAVAAFSMLRTSVGACHLSFALCGVEGVARGFHQVFGIPVKHSLYDYIFDIKSFMQRSVSPIMMQNPQLIHILTLCASLPVIPQDILQMTINLIINVSTNGEVYNEARLLFNYVETIWINSPHFTMCDIERTSRGSMELKRKEEGKTWQDFYSLIRFRRYQFEKHHRTIDKILAGERLTHKTVSLLADQQIIHLLQVCGHNFLSAWNLLETVASKISDIVRS